MNWQALERDEAEFKIGSVSRLTGIPTDTLRIWERRYNVVSPLRGGSGSRLYKHSDIARLALIKELVDQGNAISTVAGLGREELEKRLQLDRESPAQNRIEASPESYKLIVCGDTLPLFIQNNRSSLSEIQVVAEYRTIFSAVEDLSDHDADILVMEFPTFQEESIGPIQSILKTHSNFRAIIVYGFATRSALSLLEKLGISTLRAPLDNYRLVGKCHEVMSADKHFIRSNTTSTVQKQIPPRKFTQKQLMKLNNLPSNVECECPRHHVDILYSLYAFEDYSLQCNINNKEDAALHSVMHTYTASARDLMEQSLQKLIEAEGYNLD